MGPLYSCWKSCTTLSQTHGAVLYSTCLVYDEGGEHLQCSVCVVEASHRLSSLEQQYVGHGYSPKSCRETVRR